VKILLSLLLGAALVTLFRLTMYRTLYGIDLARIAQDEAKVHADKAIVGRDDARLKDDENAFRKSKAAGRDKKSPLQVRMLGSIADSERCTDRRQLLKDNAQL